MSLEAHNSLKLKQTEPNWNLSMKKHQIMAYLEAENQKCGQHMITSINI
jgi:hypothetical protein